MTNWENFSFIILLVTFLITFLLLHESYGQPVFDTLAVGIILGEQIAGMLYVRT